MTITVNDTRELAREHQETKVPGTPMVVFEGVSKAFDGKPVVENVDLVIGEGETFALVGPSGAGKTTILQLLGGLLRPTDGNVQVFGKAPTSFGTRERSAIGYVPQMFVLYPDLTVEQNARFVAGLYGIGWWRRRRRIREALKLTDLWSVRRRRTSAISGGMKRRLAVGCALLHRPRLLLVDEPTAGLDPALRASIWQHFERLRSQGVTLVLTTQYLEEANHCDRVAIVSESRIIALGSPDQLRRRAIGGEAIDVETNGFDRSDLRALANVPGVIRVAPLGWNGMRFIADDAAATTPRLLAAMGERGIEVENVHPYEPSFDDVFLAFVDGRVRGSTA